MNKKASNTALVVAGIAIVLLVAIIFYEIFRTKPVAEESQMPNSARTKCRSPSFLLLQRKICQYIEKTNIPILQKNLG